MLPRLQQFVWEQLRQMVWLLFALANAFFACLVAEFTHRVSIYISPSDAAELADAYAMASILFMVVGAHFSIERGRVLELIVPVRIMRLPMPTYVLAAAWVLTRALCVAFTIAAMLLVRQGFVAGETELVPGTSFVYYFTVYLFLLSLVRVTAIWRDNAIPWALALGVVIFAFTREGLWFFVERYPYTLLGIALLGLPIAIASIALRRRGGVYLGGLDAMPAITQHDYRRVSEIPRFDNTLSAQTWFEWRWHGKVLPGLVLFGCCTTLGAILFIGPRSGLWDSSQYLHLGTLAWSLFGVLVGAALLTTLYLVASDTLRLRGAQTRYLHVQPVGAWLFAKARQRMLLRGTAWALLFVSIVFIGGVNYAVNQPKGEAFIEGNGIVEHGESGQTATNSRAIQYVKHLAYEFYKPDPLEEWWYYAYRSGDGTPPSAPATTRVVGFLSLALLYAAVLCLGNRFALLTLGVFAFSFIWFELPEFMAGYDTPQIVVTGSIALTVLFASTLGSAVWSRLLSPQCALQYLLVYVVGGLAIYLLGPGNWVDYMLLTVLVTLFPLATPLAIIVTSRPALAVAYHARRAGGVLPPRLAAAPTDWRSTRRWAVGTAVALVLCVAAGATWRAVVASALAGEHHLARELGIAPDSPVPADSREGGLERGHFGALAAAVNPFRTEYGGITREIKLGGAKLETSADLALYLDEATLSPPAEFLAALSTLAPELQKVAKQIERLPQMTPKEILEATPPLDEDRDRSEHRYIYMTQGTSGTVEAALLQCMLLSIVAAEQRDATQCGDALHASAQLLQMYFACRDRQYIEQRAAMAGILLDSLQYTLSRVALPPGRCAEILNLLPPETSLEDARYVFHLSLDVPQWYESTFWEAVIPFGMQRYEISAGAQLQGVLETMLNMEELAVAVEAQTCNKVLVEHQNAQKLRRPTVPLGRESFYTPLNFGRVREIRNLQIAIAEGDAAISLARTALALEIYREQHGAYPEALTDLVPGILPEVPIDWLANTYEKDFTCKYVRTTPTSHRSYVVGPDRADNDGVRAVYGRRDYLRPQSYGDTVIHVNRP